MQAPQLKEQFYLQAEKQLCVISPLIEIINKALELQHAAEQSQEQYITADEARKLGAGNAEYQYSKNNAPWTEWITCYLGCRYEESDDSWKVKYRAIKQPEPVAIGMRDATYKDSTPKLHVGDSAFEDWFQAQPFATQTGVKQMCRDSYAAGMGDPLVTYATPPEPVEPTCQVKNLDTGELKTMTREAAKKLWDELGYTVEWFSGRFHTRFPADQILAFDDTKDGCHKGEPAIYTYKRKANLVKLNGKLMSPEAAIALRESKKDTCDVWFKSDASGCREFNCIGKEDVAWLSNQTLSSEYQLRERPLKQISWKDVPVGVMTNKGELRVAKDGRVWVEILEGCPGLEGFPIHCIQLAPADQQPWIAKQDGIDYPLTGFTYIWKKDVFRITGIAKGYSL